ncbi:hypothetical protein P152DRAFT_454091 [Eremomyces bilateralis CBS 781.70]|uniref:GPN-loop GTPase n=1 Tax=Eremomyces bilateralis CBS 781.70 TaxID=1392243 RepID=A0A6G1GI05_9PEZI|nr:uncharacterized protein P152DRAFT_454091 [Eremomyces bilateralis CBS 781.70]KAF1817500.1 hypothetical protein P152DRAFT_454091 [Eremomyces bilateralis CBS 781.70]
MSDPEPIPPGPVAIVVIGMAGSGKTTFMQRIISDLHAQTPPSPPYVINLDPAVTRVPFESNVDIRDSVDYKEVMRQYNLGPNGGILTSLNLFATKVDQVIGLVEKRFGLQSPAQGDPSQTGTKGPDASQAPSGKTASGDEPTPSPDALETPRYLLFDTPGQIEVFTWSASSSILLSALSTTMPTVIAYIIDTPRAASSTATFMANMLHAVSILYRTSLPMVLVFNKADVPEGDAMDMDPADTLDRGSLVDKCVRWMRDWEVFQEAVRDESGPDDLGEGSGYMSSLTNSMSLVLEEFYNTLSVVGVSSMTGQGVPEFFDGVEEKRQEFIRDYWPEVLKRRKEKEQAKESRREKELSKLMKDMEVGGGGSRTKNVEPETVSDVEAESEDSQDEDDDDEDAGLDSGLQKRYRSALEDASEGQDDDMSFARYVRNAGAMG